MSDLADGLLAELAQRTVTDKTGLSGLFDFHLAYSPDQDAPQIDSGGAQSNDAAVPYLFTALREQLGLKLEPSRGPVQVLVIDHVRGRQRINAGTSSKYWYLPREKQPY